MNELRAAAERLRRTKISGVEDAYRGFAAPGGQHLLDHAVFVDAMLDPTPITEDWLRSVGAVKEWNPCKWTFNREDALSIGLWHVDDGWKAMLIHTANAASCIVRGLTTRAQLHALCFALGVELKEQA